MKPEYFYGKLDGMNVSSVTSSASDLSFTLKGSDLAVFTTAVAVVALGILIVYKVSQLQVDEPARRMERRLPRVRQVDPLAEIVRDEATVLAYLEKRPAELAAILSPNIDANEAEFFRRLEADLERLEVQLALQVWDKAVCLSSLQSLKEAVGLVRSSEVEDPVLEAGFMKQDRPCEKDINELNRILAIAYEKAHKSSEHVERVANALALLNLRVSIHQALHDAQAVVEMQEVTPVDPFSFNPGALKIIRRAPVTSQRHYK